MIYSSIPAVLVGDSLYWWLWDSSYNILQFDLDRDSLAVIPPPVDLYDSHVNFSVMRADDGGLGFLFVSKFSVQLWKTKVICDCFASWVLGRTIETDKLFPLDSKERESPMIVGFAEENNVALMWTEGSLFMFQLESLQLKKLVETRISFYHPFESVYTAGRCGKNTNRFARKRGIGKVISAGWTKLTLLIPFPILKNRLALNPLPYKLSPFVFLLHMCHVIRV
ncbi:unnamed protein product [Triticum turgidum subsp. durum]|uniref:F-box protein AT5G49610-like beta-propeller domain-containing protein n=1 Tax=Triticum turgidum subsp. durum TaxID=4567 RepID=A0A9R1B755_TRITD|nr:unnamed protein product [Triticum turgidum subsp. durum]